MCTEKSKKECIVSRSKREIDETEIFKTKGEEYDNLHN